MNESTLVPREEMSDLDWLARNVHVWPYELQTHCYVMAGSGGKKEISTSAYSPFFSKFTKEQWLARRAKLQNKPSWGSVGIEINFISQHEDGQWIGHSEKPKEGGECFECNCIVSLFGYGEVLGDWRDTLEKRPEQKAFEPFTSIEDNQEKDMTQKQEMKQDNGWFERGELPPVGVECEVMHRDRWVACDVIAHFQQKAAMVAAYTVDNGNALKQLDSCIAKYFRPISTERDVLIEIIKKTNDTDDKIADAILAAGFSLGAK